MKLTVVMYHYVRKIAGSLYPDIKGLETEQFEGQLGYLKKYYTMVSCADVVSAINGRSELPPRPLLLSFDDGYIDHFRVVFPLLAREGVAACFFPIAKCVVENRVLSVNKIHFVLASCSDKQGLLDEIEGLVHLSRSEYSLEPTVKYKGDKVISDRRDNLIVSNIKQMLQRTLPLKLRTAIVDYLFQKYVTSDEEDFAGSLYMNETQLIQMMDQGMTIGSHGYSHEWMDSLTSTQLEQEVNMSMNFLRKLGVPMNDWTMCYPYGATNNSLIQILRDRGCGLGLTTEVNLADLGHVNPLRIPRLDTNDLPKSPDSLVSKWTMEASREQSYDSRH